MIKKEKEKENEQLLNKFAREIEFKGKQKRF